ncbi:MAG: hypothetical protein H6R04_2190 [Burkholderiaceae bacterium]|nr:hypothetical protein [Burkholderiaceae bacterium]
MRIDAGSNYYQTLVNQLSASKSLGSSAASVSDASSAGQTAAASISLSSDSADVPDFTSMTRKDLIGWMNGQIRAGKMSLDESTPFVALGMSIPVNGNSLEDSYAPFERLNFIEIASRGLEGALSRHDDSGAKALQNALDMMQKSMAAR